MDLEGTYYHSSGAVAPSGLLKAGLTTLISGFVLGGLFVTLKYAVKADWLQLIFLLVYAVALSGSHNLAVHIGKLHNRALNLFWSGLTAVWGIYISWIIRIVKLHPDHPLVLLPGQAWSKLEETFSFGIEYYVRFSRILTPGMYTETSPLTTVLTESFFILVIVILAALVSSREEFFCMECHTFCDLKIERKDIEMPGDWDGVKKALESGEIRDLLLLKTAGKQAEHLKISLYRCKDENHPGVLLITRFSRKYDKLKKRNYESEKIILKGLYLAPEQCSVLTEHLKSLKHVEG